MRLSIRDRINFGNLFKANNDTLTEAAIQREITRMILIEDDEAEGVGMQRTGNQLSWDPKKSHDRDYEFTDSQIMYLKESVYNASKARLITQDILHICNQILMLNIT